MTTGTVSSAPQGWDWLALVLTTTNIYKRPALTAHTTMTPRCKRPMSTTHRLLPNTPKEGKPTLAYKPVPMLGATMDMAPMMPASIASTVPLAPVGASCAAAYISVSATD